MKTYLQKAIFVNRAPFNKLELEFKENEISVLTAVNGKGKTTILSYIVDAFYEMARKNFPNEFEGKENKFYRVSSAIYNLNRLEPSFVYLRFVTPGGNVDYLDVREVCTQEQYNNAILIEDKIPFDQFQANLNSEKYVKKVSSNYNQERAKKMFFNNLLTYFPTYRYEVPGYLNDPYKVQLDFKKQSGFSGYLKNPIDVISNLPEIVNWIMDLALDARSDNNPMNEILFNNLNSIITQTLISKNYGPLRFGIGQRNLGGTRIQILKNIEHGESVYPTLFNISSGESSMLCIFGELARQADNIGSNLPLSTITGIVLIDEIEKHLHIKLQKEVVPKLLKLFPNVQFIISSHSPFLSMGLAETALERSKIIDLDNMGISKDPTTSDVYEDVYKMMITENDRFMETYRAIKLQIVGIDKVAVITEGKNTEHIEKAISVLDPTLLDKIKIIKGSEDKSGDQQLKNAFEIMSKNVTPGQSLIVWDCDSKYLADSVTETLNFKKFCFENNTRNSKVSKGVENLYPKKLFTKDVYDKKVTGIDYGGKKTELIFNKGKFLNKIKLLNDVKIFSMFIPLIEKIKEVVAIQNPIPIPPVIQSPDQVNTL